MHRPDEASGQEALQALSAFVRGEAGWSALPTAGLHVIDRGTDGVLMEEARDVPVARPSAAELAQGLLAYAAFATELRDWARVVVCVADLGDAARAAEGGRLMAAVWGATEGEVPDDETLVLLRRLARSGDAA